MRPDTTPLELKPCRTVVGRHGVGRDFCWSSREECHHCTGPEASLTEKGGTARVEGCGI